jgi:acetyl-CoA C-acetyltransferase
MPVVIASAVRTAIAAFQGGFSPLGAPQLGAAAVRAALERAGVAPDRVDLVLMGQVLAAGAGQAPARQAARLAGIPDRVPAVTLNKMCGSGLESVIQGARAIAAGDAAVVLAGGMESMTNAPYLLPGARGGLRLGDGALVDSILRDGLVDAYDDRHMGSCAEWCARTYAFTRQDQDDYAIRSYRRAQAAIASGASAREIVPVEVPGRRGAVTVVDTDEGPGRADFDRLPTLRPAFRPDGTITAGNASSLNDGAAALVLVDEATASERGWPVRARILGWSVHA